jgi:hypothetical protein
MISKNEWDALYREQLAGGQERLGPPPTYEEIEALAAGRMAEPEADRIRELLSYYPELLRVFTVPFPGNDEEGVLTGSEIAADLAKVRERAGRRPTSLPHAPRERPLRRALAIAATVLVAVAIGGGYLWRLTSQRRAVLTVLAYPEATRGGDVRGIAPVAPVPLWRGADYIVKPVFEPPRHYREYRLELLDLATAPPRRVWSRDHVEQQPDATYPIRLSTSELEPGLYRLVLYGVDGTIERLAEYTLRLKDH